MCEDQIQRQERNDSTEGIRCHPESMITSLADHPPESSHSLRSELANKDVRACLRNVRTVLLSISTARLQVVDFKQSG